MTQIQFKDLGLSDILLAGLTEKGFETPTPIQAQAIPQILGSDRDMIGQAQTGTGKTAAFSLPILDLIESGSGHIQALIITPTRELTLQVTKELASLKGKKKISVASIYGGQSISAQASQLKRGCDIVVGTPGRLMDHMKSKRLNLSRLKFLVLDEADEMLNSGFVEDIEWILSKSNPDRRVLLFSATMPQAIHNLAQTYMTNPETIAVKKEILTTPLTEEFFIEVRESDKFEALCRLVDVATDFYGLVFCRTKRDTDTVAKYLIERGYGAEAMHGDLSQVQRERVLDKFRRKQCRLLVVTDVASRGLDITGLTHVVNYALPQDAESYVHRVGRTGRAGQSGLAYTLLVPSEFRKIKYIQSVTKREIKKTTLPSVKEVVSGKRRRILDRIEAALEKELGDNFKEFAAELLEKHSAEDALAAILKLAFSQELSAKQYKSIKEVPVFNQKRSFRGNRNGGGGRRSDRGGPSRFSGNRKGRSRR